MLITPPCGDGNVFIAKSSADPLQGLDEALLGEDEDDQVPLYTPGHEEVFHMLSKNFNFENQIKKWPML